MKLQVLGKGVLGGFKVVCVLTTFSILFVFFACAKTKYPVSIELSPVNPSIPSASTQQFIAVGTFSDGSTQDITSSVTWTSDTTAVASISKAGLVTGADTGSATITASFGTVLADTIITVEPFLEAISVSMVDHPYIVKDATKKFIATGIYSDGSSRDITSLVAWASDSTSVATVDASGLATGNDIGSSMITATLGEFSGAKELTVMGGFTELSGTASATTTNLSLVVDTSGNIYLAGYVNGNLDGQTKTGTQDAYVIKYNSDGVKQWTKLSGVASATTNEQGLAVDVFGNVFISGFTNGNLGGQTKTGTQDAFLIKYDPSGTKQWTKLSGVAGVATNGVRVTTDASGNIYVAGYTKGNLDGQTMTGDTAAMLMKYNSSGTKLWTRLSSATGGVVNNIANGQGVRVTSSGDIYVVGFTSGDLGGKTITGGQDAFMMKYDTSGTRLWTKLLGVLGAVTVGQSITLDASENIYISGYTKGNLSGEVLTGTQDAFVAKYDPNGTIQWTRLAGATLATTGGRNISLDSYGNICISGSTTGNLDGETLFGTQDPFVIKYDASGTRQWTRLFGVAGAATSGNGFELDAFDNIYVSGGTNGNLDGQTLTGITDTFVTTRFNE